MRAYDCQELNCGVQGRLSPGPAPTALSLAARAGATNRVTWKGDQGSHYRAKEGQGFWEEGNTRTQKRQVDC